MVKLFEGALKNKGYVFKAILLSVLFWALQFAYQYFTLPQNEFHFPSTFVRSFAFTGTTLIGLALLAGPLALFFPKPSFVPHRRTMGVIGFGFVLLHIFSAVNFFFMGNILNAYFDLNPFANPLVFGGMAQTLFLFLFVTSTDWAVQKLGYRVWKAIHRLAYPAFIFTVLHFVLINPPALFSLPGFLLIGVTLLAIAFQLAGFVKTFQRKNTKDFLIGAAIIVFGLVLLWIGFFGK